MQAPALFKIKYQDEVHRIRGSIKNFDDLIKAVCDRVPNLKGYALEYKDTDGDLVRVNCEEDFQILLEENEGKKAVKIFVRESDD